MEIDKIKKPVNYSFTGFCGFFNAIQAVWTGLELFAKIAYFSGPPRGSFFGGTELLTF
ncbi:hypothetical protein [Flagellimonas crocea]|uniref:hypothetical protein n=1 Tax=Flagellimonas crocea TaxID=3067311 RepID=UPI00296EC5F4|nr:hypothetical protein [Muricauda sp. DH64]